MYVNQKKFLRRLYINYMERVTSVKVSITVLANLIEGTFPIQAEFSYILSELKIYYRERQ